MELVSVPQWAHLLANYYVVIRVDGRNKTIRRRYYRLVEREKYRLSRLGIDQRQIIAVCRYLSSLKRPHIHGSQRQASLMYEIHPQLSFDFTYKDDFT